MEAIGKQVRLPMSTAFQIAMQGIKIRLGRALVTISGVVLGIAFLMNVLTSKLVTDAVKEKQEVRQKVDLMMTLVRSEVGSPAGKTIGVIAIGKLEGYETEFLKRLGQDERGKLQGAGVNMSDVTRTEPNEAGNNAELLLVLGNAVDCPTPLDQLTAKMTQKVTLDSNSLRTYAGQQVSSDARELFFGEKNKQQQDEKRKKDQQDNFRKIWIVVISLLVTVIGIANALLMSVTERFKEIGTMKCLGALSSFIRQLFLIESTVIGVVGSLLGILLGAIVPLMAYSFAYTAKSVFGSVDFGQFFVTCAVCLVAGSLLSIIAAIYPATLAARMIPAMALRTNV